MPVLVLRRASWLTGVTLPSTVGLTTGYFRMNTPSVDDAR
jgi:hypothetical protein